MHYICNGHPFAPQLCQWNLWIHHHLDKQALRSTMDTMQCCPNHQNKWLLHICIKFYILSITYLDTSTLDCFKKSVHNPWYDKGFVVGSRFGGCFHNFYECKVSHNIERDVCLIKNNCPLFVQILFFGYINPSGNETYQKVWMLLFVNLLGPFVLFVGGVKFRTPSTWDVKTKSPSTKGFDISMATSFVCPFGIWAGTSMLFSGGRTSPPHWANNAFTHGCAFEHTTILACLLPSYW